MGEVSKRSKGLVDFVVATKKSNSGACVVSKTRSSIDGEVSKNMSWLCVVSKGISGSGVVSYRLNKFNFQKLEW